MHIYPHMYLLFDLILGPETGKWLESDVTLSTKEANVPTYVSPIMTTIKKKKPIEIGHGVDKEQCDPTF